jgi:hypothetical protein
MTGRQQCGGTRDLLGCSLLTKLVSVRNHGVTVMVLCLELVETTEISLIHLASSFDVFCCFFLHLLLKVFEGLQCVHVMSCI